MPDYCSRSPVEALLRTPSCFELPVPIPKAGDLRKGQFGRSSDTVRTLRSDRAGSASSMSVRPIQPLVPLVSDALTIASYIPESHFVWKRCAETVRCRTDVCKKVPSISHAELPRQQHEDVIDRHQQARPERRLRHCLQRASRIVLAKIGNRLVRSGTHSGTDRSLPDCAASRLRAGGELRTRC